MKKTNGKILRTFEILMTTDQMAIIYRQWDQYSVPGAAMIAQPRTRPLTTGCEFLRIAICDSKLTERIVKVLPALKGKR